MAISNAHAQLNPDSVDNIILYKFEGPQVGENKYVLCVNSESLAKGKTSVVIIGNTFSVRPLGTRYWVVMTHAEILQTYPYY